MLWDPAKPAKYWPDPRSVAQVIPAKVLCIAVHLQRREPGFVENGLMTNQ